MNEYHLAVGWIAVFLGVVHSVLGEMLIFGPLERARRARPERKPDLRRWQLRILRTTWHVATLLGWGLGGIILYAHHMNPPLPIVQVIERMGILTFLTSALLILCGTRGRHPAWLVFLIMAFLLWVA